MATLCIIKAWQTYNASMFGKTSNGSFFRNGGIGIAFHGGDIMVSRAKLYIPAYILSLGSNAIGLLQLSGEAMTVPEVALGFAL